MSKNITAEQEEIMVEFIKARPKLLSGKFSPDSTILQSRHLWQELAEILNAHPNGAKKEWNAWRKTWVDIKKNSKSRQAKIKKHQKGTGGGPPVPPDPNGAIDEKVLELINPLCIKGHEDVPEPRVALDNEVLFDGEIPPHNEEPFELNQKHTVPDEDIQLQSEHQETPNKNKGKIVKIRHQAQADSSKGTPRMTKAKRLNESIRNHSKLVSISERGINEASTYRAEKNNILKDQRKELRKQTIIMEKISNSLSSVVDFLKELV